MFRLNAAQAGYQGEQLTGFFENTRQSLASIPGVKAVALSDLALVGGGRASNGISIPGRPAKDGEHFQAEQLIVSDSFFSAMRIGLALGRDFGPADAAGGPRVSIVNETFARSFFPSEMPLGKSFLIGAEAYQIVGVCRDAKYDSLRSSPPPTMYLPYRQNPVGAMFFEVRSALPSLSMAPSVHKAVAALDSGIPLANLTTQSLLMEKSIALERLFAWLCSFLALLAVLLSYIGLYGLMAYNVARRTGEIGIRMALGAQPRDVARTIVREAVMLAAAGVAAGVPVALILAQAIRGGLYGIEPSDPATLIGGIALLLTVSILAAWIPARRASRIDPLAALRCE